jgi:hypothetical protein
VSIDIDKCCILESGCLSVTATISWATAKGLAEGQAILDRHHIVKHRVHCAGEEVETPCNILKNFCNSGFLKQLVLFLRCSMDPTERDETFCRKNLYRFPIVGI